MKNQFNDIIYIGKAKNIYQRVKSYFYKSQNHSPKTLRLIKEIEKISFLTTNTELQALLLESKLIKAHLPKYNRQIRNYKNYAFIKINLTNEYPRVYVTKTLANDSAYYFGPFNNSQSVTQEVNLLNKIFKLRTCKQNMNANSRHRSCLYRQIDQCSGPCNNQITKLNYKQLIDQVIHFLKHGSSTIVHDYVAKKKNLIENLQFEQAQKLQEEIFLLETMTKKYVQLNQALSYSNSILLFYEEDSYSVLLMINAKIKEAYNGIDFPWFINFLKKTQAKYYIPSSFLFPDLDYNKINHQALKKENLNEMKIITGWVHNHLDKCISLPSSKIKNFLSFINNNGINNFAGFFTAGKELQTISN